MRIDQIAIENFIGIKKLDIKIKSPVLLIAGPNGSSKTSVLDAIHFAFHGKCRQVTKSDQLIMEGEKDGRVAVSLDRTFVSRSVRDGLTKTYDHQIPADFSFTGLSLKDRGRLLLECAGIKMSTDTVRKRMMALCLDAGSVEAILPLLRSGFDTANKEAEGRAREAKGAWRQITGEIYGAKKAETWSSSNLPIATMESVDKLKADRETAIESLAEANAVMKVRAKASNLEFSAKQVPDLTKKIKASKEEMSRLTQKISDLPVTAGGLLTWFECPTCLVKTRVAILQSTVKAVSEETEDPASARDLRKAKTELEGVEIAHKILQNKLAAAQCAADTISKLTDSPAISKADADALREDISELYGGIRHAEYCGDAKRKNEDAEQCHYEVGRWTDIAKALAPGGIRADMTRDALIPINDHLSKTASRTGWSGVAIDFDMTVTADGRAYGLLSESEKWRADAAIQEALTTRAGANLLLLDRMDVLDLPSRSACLKWLAKIAEEFNVQTIVAATLKARPERLPDGVQCVWLPECV